METTLVTRRTFIADLGRGSVALAVLAVAGCGPALSSAASSRPSPSAATGGTNPPPSPVPSTAAATASSSTGRPGDAGFAWTRVNLGFVSAYILVRGGEAVVVDTGTSGSADDIETALAGIGLGWDDVGHVVLTHKHGDHAGSAEAVLTAATGATGYAGAADLAAITAPRPLTAVADGELVAGLRIIATPGHTAGHIAVLDEVGGILVAGDALGTSSGSLAGSNPQFTDDAAAATASLVKVGALRFETLLVGHGDPIEGGASERVRTLAAG